MIPQLTAKYENWQNARYAKTLLDHVEITEDTIKLLEQIQNKLPDVFGFRVQYQALDIWCHTNLIRPTYFKQLEDLGLTCEYAFTNRIDGELVACFSCHRIGRPFGAQLLAHIKINTSKRNVLLAI